MTITLMRLEKGKPIAIKTPGQSVLIDWWKDRLPERTRINYTYSVSEGYTWYIAASHFKKIRAILYSICDQVEVWSVHNKYDQCNRSCMNAQGTLCVCSCKGKNHMKTFGTRNEWNEADVDRVVPFNSEQEYAVRVYDSQHYIFSDREADCAVWNRIYKGPRIDVRYTKTGVFGDTEVLTGLYEIGKHKDREWSHIDGDMVFQYEGKPDAVDWTGIHQHLFPDEMWDSENSDQMQFFLYWR